MVIDHVIHTRRGQKQCLSNMVSGAGVLMWLRNIGGGNQGSWKEFVEQILVVKILIDL